MPSADGRREDDSDQPFDRMATANVSSAKQEHTSAKLIARASCRAGSRSMKSGTWARAEKSSSRLAISRLITIDRPSGDSCALAASILVDENCAGEVIERADGGRRFSLPSMPSVDEPPTPGAPRQAGGPPTPIRSQISRQIVTPGSGWGCVTTVSASGHAGVYGRRSPEEATATSACLLSGSHADRGPRRLSNFFPQ